MARKYEVTSWADGFGRWHAVVRNVSNAPGTERGYRDAARRAIRTELLARGDIKPGRNYRVRIARDYSIGGPGKGRGFSEV